MENFIRAKLGIITWEKPLRKFRELFCPLELKTQLYFLRQRAVHYNDILLTVYTIQRVGSDGPSWALIRLRRNIIFEGVVLLMLREGCPLWLSRNFYSWGCSVSA